MPLSSENRGWVVFGVGGWDEVNLQVSDIAVVGARRGSLSSGQVLQFGMQARRKMKEKKPEQSRRVASQNQGAMQGESPTMRDKSTGVCSRGVVVWSKASSSHWAKPFAPLDLRYSWNHAMLEEQTSNMCS